MTLYVLEVQYWCDVTSVGESHALHGHSSSPTGVTAGISNPGKTRLVVVVVIDFLHVSGSRHLKMPDQWQPYKVCHNTLNSNCPCLSFCITSTRKWHSSQPKTLSQSTFFKQPAQHTIGSGAIVHTLHAPMKTSWPLLPLMSFLPTALTSQVAHFPSSFVYLDHQKAFAVRLMQRPC